MRIRVRVAPNAKREEVTGEGDYFVGRVNEPPNEGKANRAGIKSLPLHFKVPQSSVIISSGFKSKDKIVEISGLDAGSSR
jgi:hypothetical protein